MTHCEHLVWYFFWMCIFPFARRSHNTDLFLLFGVWPVYRSPAYLRIGFYDASNFRGFDLLDGILKSSLAFEPAILISTLRQFCNQSRDNLLHSCMASRIHYVESGLVFKYRNNVICITNNGLPLSNRCRQFVVLNIKPRMLIVCAASNGIDEQLFMS